MDHIRSATVQEHVCLKVLESTQPITTNVLLINEEVEEISPIEKHKKTYKYTYTHDM